jgi:tetratricopeptide (TPR) repeat protein
MVIGGSLIILLGVLTLNRNKAWSSDEDLFANDLKVLSNNAKAHHNLANIYERHGNEAADEATKRTYYEGAISLIEKAETIHPVPEFYKQLGGLYGNVQRWDGSIKALNSYLELFPNEVAVLNQLGMAYGISGDLNSAQKVFKRSFELNPNDVQVCINLGKTYGMLGDYNNSLRILEKALILEPGNAEASRAYQTTQQIVGGL